MPAKNLEKIRRTATQDADNRYRAPALDKGLDILELLAATDESYSQTEIAKALGRSPNEFYRMLDRLVRRGYVHRSTGDRYELSLKLFALSHRHAPMRRLVSQAMPTMRRFAQAAGQACHLAAYDRGAVTVVAQIKSADDWGLAIRVGARVSLFSTPSGHVLLAYASERERALMLAERDACHGEETVPPGLTDRLRTIRRRGYEAMPSEQIEGVQGLSVPVQGPDGSVIATLACAFLKPIEKGGRPDLLQVLALLRDGGRELSQLVGGALPAADR